MDKRVLVPPAREDTSGAPSVFLGGSITGARDWQPEAVRLLRAYGFTGWIFNPRRKEAFSEEPGIWEEQVDWEREYLKKATVILFWLPNGAGAFTSRWEMAEFVVKGKILVVGIEEGVARKKYIEYVLRTEYRNAVVCGSLEEVCRVAVLKASGVM
jgi:hypothetical protein